ncbi:MAG: GNAT family N-acetyltransferase [Vicinamibacteria bacterium]
MTVVETERLTLRRLTLDDAEFIVGLLNEPSFLRFFGDKGVTGAAYSHLAATGPGVKVFVPLVFLAIAALSWALRPETRPLEAAESRWEDLAGVDEDAPAL